MTPGGFAAPNKDYRQDTNTPSDCLIGRQSLSTSV
jgi:hypothetical protein